MRSKGLGQVISTLSMKLCKRDPVMPCVNAATPKAFVKVSINLDWNPRVCTADLRYCLSQATPDISVPCACFLPYSSPDTFVAKNKLCSMFSVCAKLASMFGGQVRYLASIIPSGSSMLGFFRKRSKKTRLSSCFNSSRPSSSR